MSSARFSVSRKVRLINPLANEDGPLLIIQVSVVAFLELRYVCRYIPLDDGRGSLPTVQAQAIELDASFLSDQVAQHFMCLVQIFRGLPASLTAS